MALKQRPPKVFFPLSDTLRGSGGATVATPTAEVPPFKGRQTSSPSSRVAHNSPPASLFQLVTPFSFPLHIFGHLFEHPVSALFFAYLFHSIYNFLRYFGSHFGIVLASFLHDFPCLILASILHRFLIGFNPFLHGPNHVFYWKNQ